MYSDGAGNVISYNYKLEVFPNNIWCLQFKNKYLGLFRVELLSWVTIVK